MRYINYNQNPKGKRVADCVVRAISFAEERTWAEVYRDMFEQSLKWASMVNDTKFMMHYLKTRGYEKEPMPKKPSGKRYTVEEFADELCAENGVYLVNVAKHLTVIKNQDLYDTWNCSRKCVGNYWRVK